MFAVPGPAKCSGQSQRVPLPHHIAPRRHGQQLRCARQVSQYCLHPVPCVQTSASGRRRWSLTTRGDTTSTQSAPINCNGPSLRVSYNATLLLVYKHGAGLPVPRFKTKQVLGQYGKALHRQSWTQHMCELICIDQQSYYCCTYFFASFPRSAARLWRPEHCARVLECKDLAAAGSFKIKATG